MVATFRCEHCGETMTPDARGGSKIRCPHCRRRIRVPSALEALPRPIIHPRMAAEAAQPVLVRQDREPVAAGAMPWLFSAMLHVGMFLILLFIVMVTTQRPIELPPTPGPVGPVQPRNAGGTMSPSDSPSKTPDSRDTTRVIPTHPDDKVTTEEPPDKIKVDILAPSTSDADRDSSGRIAGLQNQRRPERSRCRFAGAEAGAWHVVYVIDASGSMAPAMEDVRIELLTSISHLHPEQDFHVIFFADGKIIEGPRRGLVKVGDANVPDLTKFVVGTIPRGKTTVLPAIQRALNVLKYADRDKLGKAIFVLTDGDFAGVSGGSTYKAKSGQTLNGNEAVVQYLRENNPGDVMVNTILFRQNDRSAKAVLQTIAAENRGQFKYVSSDE